MKIFDENIDSLSKRSSLLRLSAGVIAESLRNGNFKSAMKGQGIEFRDVREYFPQDNVRSIDWNVTARMGKAFVRQYEEDKELHVFFVLDRSLSMFAPSKGRSRIETAAETAALLLFAAEQNNSSVGAVFFDNKITFSTMARPGFHNAMTIFSRLCRVDENIKPGSFLPNALCGAEKLLKRRSLVFLISDVRVGGWKASLVRLAQKNDLVAIRITDALDTQLPEMGLASFVDVESGKSKKFPSSSKKFKKEWFEYARKQVDEWQSFCTHHGAFPLAVSTADDCAVVLVRFFASGAVR